MILEWFGKNELPRRKRRGIEPQGIKIEGNLMEKKERRFGKERRSRVDRRKFNDPNYKGPESRSDRDRRSGKDKRKSA